MTGLPDFLSNASAYSLRVDEKVWYMREDVRDKPQWGMHRYQHIFVRRGEMQYEYVKDMGPEMLYPKASVFQFWAGNEYSVGEVMEIADRIRDNKPPEEREPTDLGKKFMEQQEEKRALRAHRSVSGAHITIARN